jgi:hypothetical protein
MQAMKLFLFIMALAIAIALGDIVLVQAQRNSSLILFLAGWLIIIFPLLMIGILYLRKKYLHGLTRTTPHNTDRNNMQP